MPRDDEMQIYIGTTIEVNGQTLTLTKRATPAGIVLDARTILQGRASSLWHTSISTILMIMILLILLPLNATAWLVNDYYIYGNQLRPSDCVQAIAQLGEYDPYYAIRFPGGLTFDHTYGNCKYEIKMPQGAGTLVISYPALAGYEARMFTSWGWGYSSGGQSHEGDSCYGGMVMDIYGIGGWNGKARRDDRGQPFGEAISIEGLDLPELAAVYFPANITPGEVPASVIFQNNTAAEATVFVDSSLNLTARSDIGELRKRYDGPTSEGATIERDRRWAEGKKRSGPDNVKRADQPSSFVWGGYHNEDSEDINQYFTCEGSRYTVACSKSYADDEGWTGAVMRKAIQTLNSVTVDSLAGSGGVIFSSQFGDKQPGALLSPGWVKGKSQPKKNRACCLWALQEKSRETNDRGIAKRDCACLLADQTKDAANFCYQTGETPWKGFI